MILCTARERKYGYFCIPPAFHDGESVETFNLHDLSNACRLFMEQAYPSGLSTIPDDKRPYVNIPLDGLLADYLPPAPLAVCICKDLSTLKTGVPGYEFRLGSAEHPHLKLRIQQMDLHGRQVWVYSVDTHDRFLQATQHLNSEEAEAWKKLVESNRQLKHQIEETLAAAGFLTPVSLLRIDLNSPTA